MKIAIGKVLKAQGIKGEIKLGCLIDNSKMLKNIKRAYIGDNTYTVQSIRFDGTFCYVKFAEIDSRNDAELLKNAEVFADKELLVVERGRYFIDDLVGCMVQFSSGKVIGRISEVLQYGAADVIVCTGDKPCSFPFLKDLVVSVDIDQKTFVVQEKRFDEVVVYED